MPGGPDPLTLTTVAADFWSLYWSAVTFATVGYGDLHAFNVAEAIFCTLSIFTNIVINAWITGKAALPSWQLPNQATFIPLPGSSASCPVLWASLGKIMRIYRVRKTLFGAVALSMYESKRHCMAWVARLWPSCPSRA